MSWRCAGSCEFPRITVATAPPADDAVPPPCEGDFWFNTNPDELTLYVYTEAEDGNTWAPAAPPVSLEGIEQDIQDIDMAVAGIRNDVMHNASAIETGLTEQARLGRGVDEAHQKADQLRVEVDAHEQQINQNRAQLADHNGRLDILEAQDQDGGDYLLKSGDKMSGVLNMDNNYIAKVKIRQRHRRTNRR